MLKIQPLRIGPSPHATVALTTNPYRGVQPMTDSHATPAAKPANLTALQLQLADVASRSKPVPQDRSQEPRGPVLVIRGK